MAKFYKVPLLLMCWCACAVKKLVSHCLFITHPHTHNRFMALFAGTTRVSRCQKRTSGLYGAREN